MARPVREINAGSMADIAFLLLIFFLVTTTMDIDTGIARKLPPPPEPNQEETEVNKRNVLEILVSSKDWLMVNRKVSDIKYLRQDAKDFLTNPSNASDLPEKEKITEKIAKYNREGNLKKAGEYEKVFDLIGKDIEISKGVISLKNDRGTSYNMYIQVQNELAAAIRELRDEFSMEHFQMKFSQLTDEDKIDAVKLAIPVAISEAEPENVGGN